jgi:hypothetical protein
MKLVQTIKVAFHSAVEFIAGHVEADPVRAAIVLLVGFFLLLLLATVAIADGSLPMPPRNFKVL